MALILLKLCKAFVARFSRARPIVDDCGLIGPVQAEVDEMMLAFHAFCEELGVHFKALKDKFAGQNMLPPPPPPVPELGVIYVPDNQFAVTSQSFYAISSLVMPEVVMALAATKTECLQLERLALFNLEITRTMRLDDFEQLQSQHTIRTHCEPTGQGGP